MPAGRFARTALSLLIAYAIVLGGVLAPALGQGFDPAGQLCTPGGADASGDRSPDGPQSRGMHDCCPALCGAQPAILASVACFNPATFHVSAVETPHTAAVRKSDAIHVRSARAPPAG